jgi:hypothetical protein
MKTFLRVIWVLGYAAVLLAAFLYSGVIKAEELPGKTTAPAEVVEPPAKGEEAPPKKPEIPLERPPEALQQILPYVPTYAYNVTNFEPGPVIGVMAPYGYSGAYDTLIRGWHAHALGPVLVSPFLEYDEIFRTNIYQTSTDKKSDLVNTISPGLRFEMPLANKHRLSLGYLGNAFIYSINSKNSHYDQNFNADGVFNFNKVSLRVGNALRLATEERTGDNQRQRPYTRETPYIGGVYKFADVWRLEANYQFDTLNFNKWVDRFDNYQYHNAAWTLYYKFWPKTSALVQYIMSFRNHPSNSVQNNWVQSPMVGLIWDPTAKLSGTVKVGYTSGNYYTSISGRNNTPKSWSLSIQTLYRYSNYTNISLIAQRSLQEDVDFGNNGYINSGLLLTISHLFHYFKVNSYVSFSYYRDQYLTDDVEPITGQIKRRDDYIVAIGSGLSRPLTKYLKLRLDYVYNNRGSNFATYNYNEHRLLLGIQASF